MADNDILRELFNQASQNARAYMDLRFKHFATFAVVTGIVGTAAFNVNDLRPYRFVISLLGLVVTLLFWALDKRTASYLLVAAKKADQYETALGGVSPSLKPIARVFTASRITALLFCVIGLFWFSALIVTIPADIIASIKAFLILVSGFICPNN